MTLSRWMQTALLSAGVLLTGAGDAYGQQNAKPVKPDTTIERSITGDTSTANPDNAAEDDPVNVDFSLQNETGFDNKSKQGSAQFNPTRFQAQASITGIGEEDHELNATVNTDQIFTPEAKNLRKTSISTASAYLSLNPDEDTPDGITTVGGKAFQFGKPLQPDKTYLEGLVTAATGERDDTFGRRTGLGVVGLTPQTGADGGPRETYVLTMADLDKTVNDHEVELGTTVARFGGNLVGDAGWHANLEGAVDGAYASGFTASGDDGVVVSYKHGNETETNTDDIGVTGYYKNGDSGSHFAQLKVADEQDDGAYGAKATAITDESTFTQLPPLQIWNTISNGGTTVEAQYKKSPSGDKSFHALSGREVDIGNLEAAIGLGVDAQQTSSGYDVDPKAAGGVSYEAGDWSVQAEAITDHGDVDAYFEANIKF